MIVKVQTCFINHDLGLPVIILEAQDGEIFEVTVHPHTLKDTTAWAWARRLLTSALDPFPENQELFG